MSELAAGNGRFKNVSQEERVRLCKSAVKIIDRRITFGVAVSCYMQEMNHYLPKWVRGFDHAYPVCCHMAAVMLGNKVKGSVADDSIAFVFEAGHRFASSANHLMGYARDGAKELKEAYRYGSHSFVAKERAIPLQAADMLAWEWTKYRDETVDKRKRPMRKSLAALFATRDSDGNPTLDKRRYSLTHLEGAPLERFSNQIAELAVRQD